MQLVVLGMHRSGTSALTRILNLMGCYLGEPGDFNPILPDNPKGYWEHREVWALDEELLAALGGSWCSVGALDLARLDPKRRRDFDERARGLLARLDPHRPWAIKDPRLCVLFPFWRPLLESPVCVLVHRRPLQVAQSLATRNGFPLPAGIALWEHYALASLRHSQGLPRVLVQHESLMRDPMPTLRRLRVMLEQLGVDGLREPAPEEVDAFIDPELFRARGTAEEERAWLAPEQASLAAAFEDGRALALEPLPAISPGARELVAGFFPLWDARNAMEQRAIEAQEQGEREHAAHATTRETLERTRAELAGAREQLERERAQLASARGELEATRQELRQKQAELASAHDELERLGGRIGELDRQLEELLTQVAADQARIEELQRQLEQASLREQERQQTVTLLQQALSEAEATIAAAVERADELQALIELVLGSRRWRLGDGAGELVRRLTLRPAQPRAVEHAARIIADYRAWRQRAEQQLGRKLGG